jgi:mitogen-activated protein kinase organizer 1
MSKDQILTGCVDGKLRIFDIRMGKLYTHDFGAPILGLHACDDFVFVGTNDSRIHLYDQSSREVVTQYSGSHVTESYSSGISLSSDNDLIFTTSETGDVVQYGLESKQASIKNLHQSAVTCLD